MLASPARSIAQDHHGTDYASTVNTTIGTLGKATTRRIGYLDAGFTFAGPALPFGMVQFTPTYRSPNKGYVVNQLSGGGCANMGNFPARMIVGALDEAPDDMRRLAIGYRIRRALARLIGRRIRPAPNDPLDGSRIVSGIAGSLTLVAPGGILVELTATARSGMARFTAPPNTTCLTLLVGTGISETAVSMSSARAAGDLAFNATAVGGTFCGVSTPYAVHLSGALDREPLVSGAWRGTRLLPAAESADGPNSGLYFTFDVSTQKVVQYKFGISYVSQANADENLRAENPGWNFTATRRAAMDAWNGYLSRIDVRGGSADRTAQFYTHFYHALLHPSTWSDVGGDYVGADGRFHRAKHSVQYTALGSWDAYRSQVQLQSIVAPEVVGDVIASLIDFAQQGGGGLPRWVYANRETGIMLGDPASIYIANAYGFGVRNFDVDSALSTMRRSAEYPGMKSQGVLVRPYLTQYLRRGFAPGSLQLEYTSADFAIGQLALKARDDRAVYRQFLQRAGWWRSLYNPNTRWLQSRDEDGAWRPLGDDWLEATYKHYLWMVPYDIAGVVQTIGGRREAETRLDELFARLNGPYEEETFAAGNQPGLHIPWIYTWIGVPTKTQRLVRRILDEQYANRPDGMPGNDDLGSLGAWYVFASLGMYPLVPGIGGFVLNGPVFPQVTIHLQRGDSIRIDGGSELRDVVESLRVNGVPQERAWLQWSDLRAGAKLEYRLGEQRNVQWGAAVPPPSFPASSVSSTAR